MSRKQRLKARGRKTLKNVRDGLVERNEATGEDIRVSKRESEIDLRGDKLEGEPFFQLDKRPNEKQAKKYKQRRPAQVAETEKAVAPDVQPKPPDIAPDTPLKSDSSASVQTQPDVQSEPSEREIVLREQSAPPIKPKQQSRRHSPQRPQTAKTNAPPDASEAPAPNKQSAQIEPEPRSVLKHEDGGRLQFNDSEASPAPKITKKRNKPHIEKTAGTASTATPQIIGENNDSPVPTPENKPQPSPLKHDKPDKLRFESDSADTPPTDKPKQKPNQRKTPEAVADGEPNNTQPAEHRQETPKPQQQENSQAPQGHDDADTPDRPKPDTQVQADKPDSPLKTAKPDVPLKADKPGKLQFAPDEAAPSRSEIKQGRKLEKAQSQVERASGKLERAKDNLPAKKKLRKVSVVDEKSGDVRQKLQFEKTPISQGEHLKGPLPLRPVKSAANLAMVNAHSKLFQVEHENVSVKAAHRTEMLGEAGVRSALRFRKTAPYRKVAKLERAAQKKSVNLTYQKALAENPKLKSNIFSRAFQKRKIKKDYAKAAREAKKAAKSAKKAGETSAKIIKALAGVIKRHPLASAVIILVILLLFMLMSLIGAFGGMGSGGLGGILAASYLAEDVDIDDASVSYTEWETDLKMQIADTESAHAGYDEYRYNIGEISHNPYELMAYLTVKHQNFSYAAIEAELQAIFAEQYTLTFTPSVETRYTVPSDPGEEPEPYDWNVLTVTLASRSFTEVVTSRMSGDEFAHYAVLLQTKGSRQYVGNPFGFDWLPYVSSYYGYRIHPISGEKNLHRGIDIGIAAGTSILSAQDGTVTFAGWDDGYGYHVVIENESGLVTKYAHCETLLVSAGQPVSMGDAIATVGSTGNSTGPHLHFEALKDGQYLNPLFYADTGSFNVGPTYGYAGAPMGDGTYAALIEEAEKFLGWPYVWGGSSPATSFDCSGYVSWVLTQSGVRNTGRLGAQGLYNISTPVSPSDARPGDLIFFHSTYSAPNPVTHVGIYVGGNPRRMLHCGNPIGYVSIETTYWQNHFYAFGRVVE